MSNNSLLQGLTVPSVETYSRTAGSSLIKDLQQVHDEFDLDISVITDYNETRNILIKEIRDRVLRSIYCTNCADNTQEDSPENCSVRCGECEACQNVFKTEKIINKRPNCEYQPRDPLYLEFWTSFYPILDKLTQPNLTHVFGDETFKLFESSDELRRLVNFFNALIGWYNFLIDNRYQVNTLPNRDVEKYLIVRDFMDRYSILICRFIIFTQTNIGYDATLCNFKRWWRTCPDYQKYIKNTSEYNIINGLKNMLRRRTDLEKSELGQIIMTIAHDYGHITLNHEGGGEIGFIIAGRLRMPSLLEGFRSHVSDDFIITSFDPEILKQSKVHHVDRLNTKKIVKFLRSDL